MKIRKLRTKKSFITSAQIERPKQPPRRHFIESGLINHCIKPVSSWRERHQSLDSFTITYNSKQNVTQSN
jgi:hypothetical protein